MRVLFSIWVVSVREMVKEELEVSMKVRITVRARVKIRSE